MSYGRCCVGHTHIETGEERAIDAPRHHRCSSLRSIHLSSHHRMRHRIIFVHRISLLVATFLRETQQLSIEPIRIISNSSSIQQDTQVQVHTRSRRPRAASMAAASSSCARTYTHSDRADEERVHACRFMFAMMASPPSLSSASHLCFSDSLFVFLGSDAL